jgi:hypothetical protein
MQDAGCMMKTLDIYVLNNVVLWCTHDAAVQMRIADFRRRTGGEGERSCRVIQLGGVMGRARVVIPLPSKAEHNIASSHVP